MSIRPTSTNKRTFSPSDSSSSLSAACGRGASSLSAASAVDTHQKHVHWTTDDKEDTSPSPSTYSEQATEQSDGDGGDDDDDVRANATRTAAEAVQTFDTMGLSRALLRGIYSHGFESPSPIQQTAIPAFLTGRDLIAQAQSGTGKTATYCIGVLQSLDLSQQTLQAVLLAPTRELATQIHKVLVSLSSFLTPLRSHLCIGGTSVSEDVAVLERGVHVVVGAPGRVLDLVQRRALDTRSIRMFVLDEADIMLERGFLEAMHELFRYLPTDCQVALLSATLPHEILELTSEFMRDPIRLLMEEDDLPLEGIKQFYVSLDRDSYKFPTLLDLYDSLSISQAVIFCNSRRRVDTLVQMLRENDFTVSALHGEMDAAERRQIMADFTSTRSRILVATDLVARGIDVAGVSMVLNYDLPLDKEQYLHRIGRCGRYGKKGVAINFVTPRDVSMKNDIERYYGTVIEMLTVDFVEHL